MNFDSFHLNTGFVAYLLSTEWVTTLWRSAGAFHESQRSRTDRGGATRLRTEELRRRLRPPKAEALRQAMARRQRQEARQPGQTAESECSGDNALTG